MKQLLQNNVFLWGYNFVAFQDIAMSWIRGPDSWRVSVPYTSIDLLIHGHVHSWNNNAHEFSGKHTSTKIDYFTVF